VRASPTRRQNSGAVGSLARVQAGRIEQRGLLRAEQPPPDTTIVVRGGRDTLDKLRGHAQRTARAWALDGQPLFGISVFAVLGIALEELLAALGAARPNPQYGRSSIWREEG